MKHLILTVDYELFFGNDAGTVENCMIRPTRRLAEVLGEYGCKMTIFWDILHFYRLRQLENEVKDLRFDREMIEKQIRWLIKQGHDVQMQIYPHWLDAEFKNNKWRFQYNRFAIHRLWDDNDENNVETILGCVTQCRKLMEEICQKEDSNYKVRAFRAGAYRIEPFDRLANALKLNNIIVDSSASFGLKSSSAMFPYDFSKMPKYLHYRFDSSVMRHSDEGFFWEFPKESVSLSGYMRVFFYFLRSFFYTGKGRFGDGKRLWFTRREQSGHRLFTFGKRYFRLTPEEMNPIQWNYMKGRARNNSVVVLNAKNMSPFTIQMLHQSLENKRVVFRSLLDVIKELGIYDKPN